MREPCAVGDLRRRALEVRRPSEDESLANWKHADDLTSPVTLSSTMLLKYSSSSGLMTSFWAVERSTIVESYGGAGASGGAARVLSIRDDSPESIVSVVIRYPHTGGEGKAPAKSLS